VNFAIGGQGDIHPPIPDPLSASQSDEDLGLATESQFLDMQLAVLHADQASLEAQWAHLSEHAVAEVLTRRSRVGLTLVHLALLHNRVEILRLMIDAVVGTVSRREVLSQTVPACCTQEEEDHGGFGQQGKPWCMRDCLISKSGQSDLETDSLLPSNDFLSVAMWLCLLRLVSEVVTVA